jgi:predicted nuclease of predicted toxin-antitoxin system
MKLLFDEHISSRTVRALNDLFPEAKHVSFFNLDQESDESIWQFARKEGFTIITKDDDFHQKSLAFGQPPKVIWIKTRNAKKRELEKFIREKASTIAKFVSEGNESLLILQGS